MTQSYKQKLSHIKAFVFDVDGVLTDGNITLMPDGSMARVMNTRDGYAMQLAIKKGFLVAIITGGNDQMVKQRLNKLGVTDVYLASHNKIEDFEDFTSKYDITPDQVIYMGDDIPDMEVMKIVGLPTCPKDACTEIKTISQYISFENGGKGAARDIIEKTMKIHGKWNDSSFTKSI